MLIVSVVNLTQLPPHVLNTWGNVFPGLRMALRSPLTAVRGDFCVKKHKPNNYLGLVTFLTLLINNIKTIHILQIYLPSQGANMSSNSCKS